eukprot:39093-Hanusia_phi.AAC.1
MFTTIYELVSLVASLKSSDVVTSLQAVGPKDFAPSFASKGIDGRDREEEEEEWTVRNTLRRSLVEMGVSLETDPTFLYSMLQNDFGFTQIGS